MIAPRILLLYSFIARMALMAIPMTFSGNASFAQSAIYSLKANLKNENNDSARSVWLNKIGYQFRLSNRDSALLYNKRALSKAALQNLDLSVRDYWQTRGQIFDHVGQTDSAAFIYRKLLEKDTTLYLDRAGWVLNRLGELDTENGYYNRSLDYLLEALEYRVKYEPEQQVETLSKLALLFYANHDCEGGFLYAWKAKNLLTKYGPGHAFSVCNSIAQLHMCQQNYDSAKYYYQLGYKPNLLMEDSPNHGDFLHNSAYVTETIGDKRKGVNLYKQALALKQKYNSSYSVTLTHYGMAEVYFEIAWYEKLPIYRDTAIYYVKKVIENAEGRRDIRLLKKANGLASDLYAASGDLSNYYKHKNQFMSLNDSLFNISRDVEMVKLESNYLMKDKEADNLRLANENLKKESVIQRQNYLFVGAVLTILLIAGLLYNVYRNNLKTKALNKQIENSNRTKDRLFSIISHDLRGPIAAFETAPKILRSYLNKNQPEKVSEIVDHIDRSAKSLNQLLDNLLNWSLSQKEELVINIEKLAVKPIMDEILEGFQDASKLKGITIESMFSDQYIMADQNTFSTVVRNLLSNAIKFSHPNSTITIDHRVSDNWLEFTFSDTGTGMGEEQLENLFYINKSKVRTGTAKEKGTGLGMVLVKEFIDINKGKITVESKPDKGTTFYVSLPLAS